MSPFAERRRGDRHVDMHADRTVRIADESARDRERLRGLARGADADEIGARDMTRALPRASVGRCGAFCKTARLSARIDRKSSAFPFGADESQSVRRAEKFMGLDSRAGTPPP
jgi:hypothetical protein